MSYFTPNSYFVLINSVSIIRNCRAVTTQINIVLTNYLSTAEETEAASEVVLDVFTLQHFKCINHFIRLMFSFFFLNIQINVEKKCNDTFIIDSLDLFKNMDSFCNETPLCVARRHNSSAVALVATIFVSEIEQKQSIFCLKSKSLNLNLLFIEILFYKNSVTLQSADIVIRGNIMAV